MWLYPDLALIYMYVSDIFFTSKGFIQDNSKLAVA